MNLADPFGFCPETDDELEDEYRDGVQDWMRRTKDAAPEAWEAINGLNGILDQIGGMGVNALKNVIGGGAGSGGGGGGRGRGGGGANDNVVIGKMKDLDQLPDGERTLVLPDMGSPKANWNQNSGRLREAMVLKRPIRDATLDEYGYPTNNTGFLRAERNLLSEHGWVFDPTTRNWVPGGK